MPDPRNLVDAINGAFESAINRGFFIRTPLFWRDYDRVFPELRELEKSFPAIRAECEELLRIGEDIPTLESVGGQYTKGGVHSIQWKSYMLKLGDFVEENCARCPETAKALAKVPKAYLAFFSILFPGQHIRPHFGYYKGCLRYHLGLIIPEGDENETCWLRVNGDPDDNAKRDKSTIDRGEVYNWTEGEGVIFDDTLLHEASNDTDGIRVVLFVDVRRPLPLLIDWVHRVCVWLALKHPIVRKVRNGAVVETGNGQPG
jgi:aspartyl/asparaginyl beta-hydroxylase (cupin superfamily)